MQNVYTVEKRSIPQIRPMVIQRIAPRAGSSLFPLATVTVFKAGTSTLATIYANSSLNPLTNPFTADVTGNWDFFALTGSYDVQFSGAGLVAPFTIQALGQSISTFLGSHFINVRDYGATGNGVTNDTVAFQAAINAGAGGMVVIPAGSYLLTSLNIPSSTRIVGAGDVSRLFVTPGSGVWSSADANIITVTGQSNVQLEDFRITGAGKDYAGVDMTFGGGIIVTSSTNVKMSGVHVENANIGISVEQSQDCAVTDCLFTGKMSQDGVRIFNYGGAISRSNIISNCICDYAAAGTGAVGSAFRIGGIDESNFSDSMTVTGNTAQNITGHEGFIIENARTCAMTGNTARACGYGIVVRAGIGNVISGNTVRDCTILGILLQPQFSTRHIDDNIIDGNVVINSGNPPNFDAIYVARDNPGTSATGASCDSNQISNNTINTPGRYGIYVTFSATHTSILGNHVVNGPSIGIFVQSASVDTTVSNNFISGCASHAIYTDGDPGTIVITGNHGAGQDVANTYGIFLNSTAASRYVISGNRFDHYTNSVAVLSTAGLLLDSGNEYSGVSPVNLPGPMTVNSAITGATTITGTTFIGTGGVSLPPATSGVIRIPAGQFIAAHDVSPNTGDVDLIGLDANRHIALGQNGETVAVSGNMQHPQPSGQAVFTMDVATSSVSILSGATYAPFGPVNIFNGLLMMTDTISIGATGLFLVSVGLINQVALVSDPSSAFSTAAGTAGKINVYLDASHFLQVQNLAGVNLSMSFISLRTWHGG